MEILDKRTFEDFVKRLFLKLDRQDERIASLQQEWEDKAPMPKEQDYENPLEGLMDNQELCLLLNVSKRTMQRYRSEGLIPYRLVKRTPYYDKEDVAVFVRRFSKEIKKEQNKNRKARIYL